MMPSKKKKYNARFPAGRIKKIMQTDDDVGKVAQAVPVIISRALELFVESLLTKAVEVTNARNAKTLTPSHMKQCILSESRFDFLKDLVSNISEVASAEEDISPPVSGQVQRFFPSTKKPESGRGRGRGGSRNSSVSSSVSAMKPRKSVTSSQPTTPTTPIPPFYKDNPVFVSRPPVIQHTGPSLQRPPLDDSGDEEDDDAEQENSYEELTNHSTRPLLIDDDYDT